MNKIAEFKKAYERFSKALKYISENESDLKADQKKWKNVINNFQTKFEDPLEASWNSLSPTEKRRFESLYLHRKAMQNELVKKIVEMFNGTVVND